MLPGLPPEMEEWLENVKRQENETKAYQPINKARKNRDRKKLNKRRQAKSSRRKNRN